MNEYKPTPLLLRPLQLVYCLYAYALFIVFMFVALPFVMISATMGRLKGGNMVNAICRIWGDLWLPLIGIFHRNIYESPIDEKKQYVFVANHISYMDIPVIFQGVRKKHFRILAKIETSKIPVFGFVYRNATVMVDRSSAVKRAKSVAELRAFMAQDISIYIYPEGTFNETGNPLKSFYDGAFRLAIETQTPIKPIVYPDTINRLHYKSIFCLTPGKSRAVILPEIPVEGYTMEQLPLLKQQTHDLMEACFLRYARKKIN